MFLSSCFKVPSRFANIHEQSLQPILYTTLVCSLSGLFLGEKKFCYNFAPVYLPITPTGCAVLAYIKGSTEPLTRVLCKRGIKFLKSVYNTTVRIFPSQS